MKAGVHTKTKPAVIGWSTMDSTVVPQRDISSTQLLDAGGHQCFGWMFAVARMKTCWRYVISALNAWIQSYQASFVARASQQLMAAEVSHQMVDRCYTQRSSGSMRPIQKCSDVDCNSIAQGCEASYAIVF